MNSLQNDIKQLRYGNPGFHVALSTVILSVITFCIAILTPPLSGPLCKDGCFTYPFADISSRFPRDYYWMYPAMLLSILFIFLMVHIHYYAAATTQRYSLAALLFALIGSSTLLIDYFIQVSVIQPSLLRGETDGIAIFTQYNSHGLFIVLEEVGYTMISLALFSAIPVFSRNNKLEKAIRIVFFTCFVVAISGFILITAIYGIRREYRFELLVITIVWTTLIVGGILLARLFKLKTLTSELSFKSRSSFSGELKENLL
jgi:hypothetical protein